MARGHHRGGPAPCAEQIAIACGQRGWKRQPDGGASRLGAPPRAVAAAAPSARRRASGFGAALSSSWV